MIQVYADGKLVVDTRLEDYNLISLPLTRGLNKSGTASIVMPPNHPAYNDFVEYKTLVEIYQDNRLKFRGRALYHDDDFYNRRTVFCEGERGFFQDAVIRPYNYQADPATIFESFIALYNAEVDEYKRFEVGEITVTDPNDYVAFESESATKGSAFLDKLVERCGGYITFSTTSEGKRAVNWLAELNYSNNQVVEFGENLLDFARSGANTALATRLIPYGAKDESTGQRITIESVNDGLDYVEDEEAVQLRGIITDTATWDDVTEPANLLTKAKAQLAQRKLILTSLKLTAVDLSVIDKSLDSFEEGDIIRVISKPHQVDEYFLLTDKSEDLLDAKAGEIDLGKENATLTGSSVTGDRQNADDLESTVRNIRAEYLLNVAQAVEKAQQTLTSLIEQTSESILLEVSEKYATDDEVESSVSAAIEVLKSSITLTFEEVNKVMADNTASTEEAHERLNTVETYFRFTADGLHIGTGDSGLSLLLTNDRISFLDAGAEVAYVSNNRLYITDGEFLNSLQIGRFKFQPRENGNLSLIKVGD